MGSVLEYYVDVGGKVDGPYDDVKELSFPANGKKFAYTVKTGGKRYVIDDNEKMGPYIE